MTSLRSFSAPLRSSSAALRSSSAALRLGIALALLAACDGPPPTTRDGGMDADLPLDGSIFPDGTVFCETDEDCDDGVGCTEDVCLSIGSCRNSVIPAACDDGVFCNGAERCDPTRGCMPPISRETCNDDDVCTIDRCDEATDRCAHFPRDLDEDGDVDFFCAGGGDCDDRDSTVSSMNSEVCADFIDNDCDGEIDEADCGAPPYDTCDDPLDVSAGGFFLIDTTGSNADYPTTCGGSGRRDLVATFTLEEARSVRIEGEGDFFTVTLALRSDCDDMAAEIACESGFPGMIRRRSLEPGTYYVLASSSVVGEIGLTVSFGEPVDPATNDLCATPVAIDPAVSPTVSGSFAEVGDEATTRCGFSGSPDLFYTFTTTAEQDVEITALSSTGESLTWSLRPDCAGADLRCVYGAPAMGRVHQLPMGTYIVVVEGPSWADVDFTLDVRFHPPSPPPPGDTCASPLPVTLGTPVAGTLLDKQDDLDVSCGFRYRDVVHTFTLDADSDVTVELDAGVFANMSIRRSCEGPAEVRCASGSPPRARLRNMTAGTYYVIAESSRASSYTLSVDATTPPTVPVEVADNDSCPSAHEVPATGGLFHGSTAAPLVNDYTTALCGSSAGSSDAAYRLSLTSRQRVVMSTEGSSFDTVLHVHRDACTSGAELYCDDDGGDGSTSLIDRVLDPGTYFIIVDGYSSASSGEYYLEVMVSDP